ncbi:MAG: glycosyltransferase family 2 protein [Vicinamibacterales bacterium]
MSPPVFAASAPPPTGASLPFVSVVLPIRNEAGHIGRTLRSVLDQDYPAERMEVIVADGMSSDATRDIVDEVGRRDPRVRLIDNPGRIVATGLNAAVPLTSGSVIVRVDGHCEIEASYVRRVVAQLADRTIAAVGGPLDTIGDTAWARAIAVAMSSRFGVGDSTFRVGAGAAADVDTVAFPGYSRDALRRAGPFDEELVRNQDDEYSYRLRSLGYRVVFVPEIRAVYHSRSTLRSLWRQYFQYGFWKVRVLQKRTRQMRPRQFVPPLFVAGLLGGSAAALTVPGGWVILGVVLAPYLAANLLASAAAAGVDRALLLRLPPTFLVLHVAYGAGFLTGLCRFASRWLPPASRPDPTERPAWL